MHILNGFVMIDDRYAQMATAKTEPEDASAAEALRDFQRFPTWFVSCPRQPSLSSTSLFMQHELN
jgi:hypothetical protein